MRRALLTLVSALTMGFVGAASAAERPCPETFPLILNGGALALSAPAAKRPFVILAIGSSSTQGVGASAPDRTYPARLAAELSARERVPVDVVNAGVGGETADRTLNRLEQALDLARPALVIWQVGTNDALKGADEARFRGLIEEGVAAARAHATPILLMDPQYAADRNADSRIERFDTLVDATAARLHTPLLERFQSMKTLASQNDSALKSLLAADGLHMNDLGYACLAHALADPIAAAIGRGAATF